LSGVVTTRTVGRIQRRGTFLALRRPAGRAVAGSLRVSWVPPQQPDPFPLVSYAIGRRCGNAVDRNRLRRRLRAAVAQAELAPGTYLVTAEPAAAKLSFAELASTVGSAMDSAAARGTR
jgi:ribonuclease P protein component